MEAADHIRDAVLKIMADNDEQPMMIGDLVTLAEFTDEDGNIQLLTVHNIEITRWKEVGMLSDRLLSINEGHFVLGLPEDD